MKDSKWGIRISGLLLAVVMVAGFLVSCGQDSDGDATSGEDSSQLSGDASVPESNPFEQEYLESAGENLETLGLVSLYETTASWNDALASGGQTEVTFEGDCNRMFFKLSGMQEAFVADSLFGYSVARVDGSPAYAMVIPLRTGISNPAFALCYDMDTQLTDYVVTVTTSSAYGSFDKEMSLADIETGEPIKAGMVFPGELVEIGETVYYYAGPDRNRYDILEPDTLEGSQNGFALAIANTLAPAEKLYATAEEWNTVPRAFDNTSFRLVMPEDMAEPDWPSGEGVSVTASFITPESQYNTTMNDQTALAKVSWVWEQDVDADLDNLMQQGIAALYEVAFQYGEGDNALYFMPGESYYRYR